MIIDWLPIHCLRILREPDEEVTPEDIVTIKLLVAAWPSQPTFLSSIQMIQQMIQTSDEALYNAVRARGRAAARHPPPMPRDPLPPHWC
jgi:hypothetical protein